MTYPRMQLRASTTTTLAAQQHEDDASTPAVEEMRQDISRLEREAAERLQNLMEQMDDLAEFESRSVGPTIATPVDASTETAKRENDSAIDAIEITKEENGISQQHQITSAGAAAEVLSPPPVQKSPQQQQKKKNNNKQVADPANNVVQNIPRPPIPSVVPLDKLAGTSWRLVFNIGREEGTWMPKDWGSSGDRLRFECKVRFTNATVSSKSNANTDDFFHPKPYCLEVSEGYLWPTGVGVGRKPLRMDSSSAADDPALFQIVPGTEQGDVLRMRVPLGEAVNRSDVTCPRGNLYVTANYYGLPEWHCRMRDHALQEWTTAQATYETAELKLELAGNEETQGLGWFGYCKLMADVWKAKHALEDYQRKYIEAQHRFPEKIHLRFDAKERVALSREGGLCLKIHSGVAIEYHILGRVEIGCLDKKKTPDSVPSLPGVTL